MRIPKRFQLLGGTIEVVESKKLIAERNWSGAADYHEQKIEIVPISDSYAASRARIEQVFCHEVAHFLCYHAGAAVNHHMPEQLHHNEEFIDLLGSLIHQVFDTMEYDAEFD